MVSCGAMTQRLRRALENEMKRHYFGVFRHVIDESGIDRVRLADGYERSANGMHCA